MLSCETRAYPVQYPLFSNNYFLGVHGVSYFPLEIICQPSHGLFHFLQRKHFIIRRSIIIQCPVDVSLFHGPPQCLLDGLRNRMALRTEKEATHELNFMFLHLTWFTWLSAQFASSTKSHQL